MVAQVVGDDVVARVMQALVVLDEVALKAAEHAERFQMPRESIAV